MSARNQPAKHTKPRKPRKTQGAREATPSAKGCFTAPMVAARLSQAVADAQRDYERSIEARKHDWEKGVKLTDRAVNGVLGHAHRWCVDFKASADELVAAGLALPTWFRGEHVCKRVLFDGREIEIFRPWNSEYELSILYRKP